MDSFPTRGNHSHGRARLVVGLRQEVGQRAPLLQELQVGLLAEQFSQSSLFEPRELKRPLMVHLPCPLVLESKSQAKGDQTPLGKFSQERPKQF